MNHENIEKFVRKLFSSELLEIKINQFSTQYKPTAPMDTQIDFHATLISGGYVSGRLDLHSSILTKIVKMEDRVEKIKKIKVKKQQREDELTFKEELKKL